MFLQEIYLQVESGLLTIDQAASKAESRISAFVGPTGNGFATAPDQDDPEQHPKTGLKAGAYAGIGVGCTILIIFGIGILVWRVRTRKAPFHEEEQDRFDKSELDGQGKPRVEALSAAKQELETTGPEHEFAGRQLLPFELAGSKVPIYELEHSGSQRT